MSVSFDLDSMADNIEKKEPGSPRGMVNGEYIEDECKFLLPPKSMAHPRLFYVRSDGSGAEFMNFEQLKHMFRTYRKNKEIDLIQNSQDIKVFDENCVSHSFIKKISPEFNAQAFDVSHEFPKLPQTLEMVN